MPDMNLSLHRIRIVLLCVVTGLIGIAGNGLNHWHGADLHAGEIEPTLLESAQAVATLHRLYPIFTDPAHREGMSLQQRQAVEVEAQHQLQLLPMDLLLPQMEKHAVVYSDQLQSFADPQEFVARLSRVAMNGIITPTIAELPVQGAIRFKPGTVHADDVSTFAGTDRRIFAVFDSSAYGDTRVLVKWYHLDHGRVLLFRQFEIADSDSNYIWLDNENGFDTGSYRVEIYRLNEGLTLLSSGEYRIKG
jgi:hypothetical protein